MFEKLNHFFQHESFTCTKTVHTEVCSWEKTGCSWQNTIIIYLFIYLFVSLGLCSKNVIWNMPVSPSLKGWNPPRKQNKDFGVAWIEMLCMTLNVCAVYARKPSKSEDEWAKIRPP